MAQAENIARLRRILKAKKDTAKRAATYNGKASAGHYEAIDVAQANLDAALNDKA